VDMPATPKAVTSGNVTAVGAMFFGEPGPHRCPALCGAKRMPLSAGAERVCSHWKTRVERSRGAGVLPARQLFPAGRHPQVAVDRRVDEAYNRGPHVGNPIAWHCRVPRSEHDRCGACSLAVVELSHTGSSAKRRRQTGSRGTASHPRRAPGSFGYLDL